MPKHLTKDTIEKRGDKYVLVSSTGEVLGEFDTQAAAEVARSQADAATKTTIDSLIVDSNSGSDEEKARAKSIMCGLIETLAPGTLSESDGWVDTVDFAPFSKVDSRDANGFLRVVATVTAPGVYAYVRNGKLRHELKPDSEIFAPLHMESVHGAVVTDEHPPGAVAVTPENSSKLQRGHSMSPPTRSAAGLDVELVVTDAKLIEAAESKRKTGVSLGMRNTFDHAPGIWTAPDGSKHPYEVIQTNMVTNHIAIVSTPRVTSAQLHLDSLEQDGPQETNTMEKQATLTIDGADFEIDANIASVVRAHLGRQDKLLVALQAKLKEATTSNDSLAKEKDEALAGRDTAFAERDGLKEKLATADSVDMNEMVAKRLTFLDRAKSVMTADHFEEVKEKSDLKIMKHACTKSGAVMTEDSDAYLRARFDTMVDSAATTNDSKLKDASLHMPAVTPSHASEQAEINKTLKAHYANNGRVAH